MHEECSINIDVPHEEEIMILSNNKNLEVIQKKLLNWPNLRNKQTGKKQMIFPPATDFQGENDTKEFQSNGEIHVNAACKKAAELMERDDCCRVFIPIVQTRPIFFGLFGPKRQHFTYLQLEKSTSGAIEATHVDSKGFLGRLYPLAGIRDALAAAFPNDKIPKLNTIYVGQQGLFDDHNSGKFALLDIQYTAENNYRLSKHFKFQNHLRYMDAAHESYTKKHAADDVLAKSGDSGAGRPRSVSDVSNLSYHDVSQDSVIHNKSLMKNLARKAKSLFGKNPEDLESLISTNPTTLQQKQKTAKKVEGDDPIVRC